MAVVRSDLSRRLTCSHVAKFYFFTPGLTKHSQITVTMIYDSSILFCLSALSIHY